MSVTGLGLRTAELAVIELWEVRDLIPPTLPPRSRLFHLEPVGLGTPWVESLTDYIARLAEAHGIETNKLVTREILPLLGRANLTDPLSHGRITFWQKLTPGINGPQSLACEVASALEKLTLRSHLGSLTMSPWAEVVSPAGLLHRTAAWCPVCYEEWRQAGQVIYEPLPGRWGRSQSVRGTDGVCNESARIQTAVERHRCSADAHAPGIAPGANAGSGVH